VTGSLTVAATTRARVLEGGSRVEVRYWPDSQPHEEQYSGVARAARPCTVLQVELVSSPLGQLLLYSTGATVCCLDFLDLRSAIETRLKRRYGRASTVTGSGSEPARRLARYFEGDIAALDGIPIDPGGTPFQRDVWQAIRSVEPGTCRTYSWLAAAVGRPHAFRAVGGASSRNPIALVIPCHRVVGADGSLVGYAGGVERKRWLLRHERGRSTRGLRSGSWPTCGRACTWARALG
jgi:methylated-DNA-[protein]-cysteine S-methyltransferase